MKKTLCGALALLLCLSLLVGCGESQTPTETTVRTERTEPSTTEETTARTEETTAPATEAETTAEETTAEETTTVPVTPPVVVPEKKKTMSEDELLNRLSGGWLGQMIGVAWCASTEFRYHGSIMPESGVPAWKSSMINGAFAQDDVYVEIPLMEAMRRYGYDCDVSYLAEEFKTSSVALFHANAAGRDNLLAGIPYPYSGSYLFNEHADDIDWQIECDFLGMMYPGMVNEAASRAFEIGHIMNYGDGVYGGVMIAAMHAAAYTADSVEEIVEAGFSVLPDGTKFKDLMSDLLDAYRAGKSWEEIWRLLETKWAPGDRCPTGAGGSTDIDAKLNCAYVVLGLLYGEGDLAKTVQIACRCGQDSDCNPSSAASVLCTYLGADAIPADFTSALTHDGVFQATDYTYDQAVQVNFELLKAALAGEGIAEKNADGTWTLIGGGTYTAVPYEQWPEDFYVSVYVTSQKNRGVSLRIVPSNGEIEASEMNFGDGFVTDEPIAYYTYEKAGSYTLSCRFTSTAGERFSFTYPIEIEDNLRVSGTAICSVENPTGGSSKNVGVIYDGVVPTKAFPDKLQQYITSQKTVSTDPVYAGVTLDVSVTLTGVRFTEGIHFSNGGWFEEVPSVEVRIGGVWTAVEVASVSPDYPIGGLAEHGDFFETYTFTLATPVVCDGVRLIGIPGGAARYISVGEIEPVLSEIHFADSELASARDIITANVTAPTGSGARSAGVIRDGILPTAGAASTAGYDTYTGDTATGDTYIGYLFRTSRTVKALRLTEGAHYASGGWFRSGDLRVEVKIDGKWQTASAAVSPAYPVGDSTAETGAGYGTYTFTLSAPTLCEGIRIIGTAGGTSTFISVGELELQ